MGRTIAYCRVSSRDQNPELQVDALRAHGYDQMFAEKESGKRGVERAAFAKAQGTAAAAEYELELRAERQAEGIAVARRRRPKADAAR